METTATKTIWKIDTAHSEVQFKVKHMMIASVTGTFEKFDATIEADGDKFENAKISFTADAASVNTNSTDRDNHLRSADFFNADNHPQISFESTAFIGENLSGNLSMRGVTKPVTLHVDFGGVGKDPWGNVKAGFTITGKINRKDWGLNWNAALEAGGVLVSEDVRINCEVQFTRG